MSIILTGAPEIKFASQFSGSLPQDIAVIRLADACAALAHLVARPYFSCRGDVRVELISDRFHGFYAAARASSFAPSSRAVYRASRSLAFRLGNDTLTQSYRGINVSRLSILIEVQSSASRRESIRRAEKQHRIAEGSLRELTGVEMAARKENPRWKKNERICIRTLFSVKTRVKDVTG